MPKRLQGATDLWLQQRQSNNGKFKHEYAFVTGLRRDGWTRLKQDNDEIRMTKLEVMTNDQ